MHRSPLRFLPYKACSCPQNGSNLKWLYTNQGRRHGFLPVGQDFASDGRASHANEGTFPSPMVYDEPNGLDLGLISLPSLGALSTGEQEPPTCKVKSLLLVLSHFRVFILFTTFLPNFNGDKNIVLTPRPTASSQWGYPHCPTVAPPMTQTCPIQTPAPSFSSKTLPSELADSG